MSEEILTITPDKEKVNSILKMVEIRTERIQNTSDVEKFSSLLIEDYYELIKELTTALLNLSGYKTLSHKILFDWLSKNYDIFTQEESEVIEDLRKTRNRIVYDGFFVKQQYLEQRITVIEKILSKLKNAIESKL